MRILILVSSSLVLASAALAQQAGTFQNSDETRAALERAQREAAAADKRSEQLEAQARAATEEAEKTAREGAALAARIQQAEAAIAAADARISLIDGQRATLSARLAQRRGPLIRLTAGLQKLARRPLALSALKPGSLRETVYLRAILGATIPQVQERTAALRAEIARGKQLEAQARQALASLKGRETELAERQNRLAALETRQRLKSRQAGGDAAREGERALALAEEARDLDSLVSTLDTAGSLRKELEALPGPVIRPQRPQAAQVAAATAASPATTSGGPGRFQLPVIGRTIAGFGTPREGGVRNQGISLAPRPGAQVVAPEAGRVAFAGPYRGYDRIVIVEHQGGWTSLVTGLARTDVAVGDSLVAGGPLGVAGVDRPIVTLELRRNGQPVNPAEYLR